jgi:hypothetical protein
MVNHGMARIPPSLEPLIRAFLTIEPEMIRALKCPGLEWLATGKD